MPLMLFLNPTISIRSFIFGEGEDSGSALIYKGRDVGSQPGNTTPHSPHEKVNFDMEGSASVSLCTSRERRRRNG